MSSSSARQALAAGDLRRALDLVSEEVCASAQGRDAADAWLARSRVLLHIGAVAEARAAAADARNRSVREGWKPEAADAYLALAGCDLAEGRFAAAELALEKARELARDSAPQRDAAADLRADFLWRQRRLDELRAELPPDGAATLARLRLEIEDRRWPEAAALWERLPTPETPSAVLAHLLAGETAFRGRGDESRAAALRNDAERRAREWADSLPPTRQEAYLAHLRALGIDLPIGLATDARVLAEAARRLHAETRLPPILAHLLDAALAACGAECAYVVALGEAGAECRVARHAGGRAPAAAEVDYSRRIAEQVAREGRPFVSGDAQADARLADHRSILDAGSRAVLCVPLRVRDRAVGALYLHSTKRAEIFGARERALADALADLAALAIERTQLLDQVVLAQVLAEGPELAQALPRALEAVVRALRADRGFLFTRRAGGKPERVAAFPGPAEDRGLPFSESVLAEALAAGKPTLVNVPEDPERAAGKSIRRLGVSRALCVPVAVDDDFAAILYLEGGPETRELGEDSLPLLESFARRLAAALRVGVVVDRQTKTIQRLNAALDVGLKDLRQKHERHGMVGRGASMTRVFEAIERFAPFPYPVLVTGETGTGKELTARAIHYASPRRDRPFLAVNCGALPRELIESELFGHAKGAFTGADRDRVGMFEAAHQGTLFLDEVEAMGDAMQVGLLRVLQEHEVRPVGGRETRKVDVRVVAATNQDLAALAREGRFRSDLLFRLQVFALHLPPLRERTEDIPDLVARLLAKIAEETGTPPRAVDAEALRLLRTAAWEGNVRELENALKQAVAYAGATIAARDLPARLAGSAPAAAAGAAEAPRKPIDELWKNLIRQTLDRHGGNVVRAAEELGISRTTLYKRMKEYGLEAPKT